MMDKDINELWNEVYAHRGWELPSEIVGRPTSEARINFLKLIIELDNKGVL